MNRMIGFSALSTALSIAIVLGTASAAPATERDFGPRSYRAQTWQDIEQDRLDIQRQIQAEYHLGTAGNTEGNVVSPKHHPSHKQTHDR
jgi:hypothetical protein